MYWQAGYTALAQAVTAALQGQPLLPPALCRSNRAQFLGMRTPSRTESALHYLEDKVLSDVVKQELVHSLETEARLYALLLDPRPAQPHSRTI
ncbi:MAG: hypothetical protein U0401_20255 [Anaerolineae bacterium]